MPPRVSTPTSRLRFGLARVEITPPIGIYHGFWGAARHDRATGIHRPLFADVMAFGPLDGTGPPLIRAQLDLCGLVESQHQALIHDLREGGGAPVANVIITYSHTHASGWFVPDRFTLPGGELIPAYLARLAASLQKASRDAVSDLRPVTITYATGRCGMAANRDYWDKERGAFVCGFNPGATADDTVIVACVTDGSGRRVAAFVHYACHPTTLGWENTLISPDYVGAMRESVENSLGVPCVFFQGACGDLGPREGFTGDPAVADRNGRQLGAAALAAIESLGPPETDFEYTGPVTSGATLGTWAYVAHAPERQRETAVFAGGGGTVDLPLKPRPDPAALRATMEQWLALRDAADARGNAATARDCHAQAERSRRWLARLPDLPTGPTYPFRFSVYRLGDALWITCGGEPYSFAVTELRRRFPHRALLFSPLAGDFHVAYLLPADRYGQGLYQEEPSLLAAGCLELLIEAMAASIAELER